MSEKLINISAYCTPREYEHLQERRDAFTERTGRKISISRFTIEQPDRQESELAALKRVYELNIGIVELYQQINTVGVNHSSPTLPTGNAQAQRKTNQRVEENIADSMRKSDKTFEDPKKRKYDSDGNLLILDENTGEWKPKPKPNPHIAMIAEMKEKLKQLKLAPTED